jgi:hypothetical protein
VESIIDQHWKSEWIDKVAECIREISGMETKKQRLEKASRRLLGVLSRGVRKPRSFIFHPSFTDVAP